MQYVTTRCQDTFHDASITLTDNRGSDGGLFIPAVMPHFSEKQIMAMGEKSFAANVVEIINLLFDTKLSSWSLEFAIGRYPVNLVSVSGRATIAETWHNPAWKFDRLVRGVEKAIRQSDQINPVPTDWLTIASRTAVLFGIFGELIREGAVSFDNPMDVAVPSGDFSPVMAAWYAREWGLPIGNIICGSNENPAAWNLLHKGELRTDVAVIETQTPACDHTVPEDLERLIYHTLGLQELRRFLDACELKSNYYLERWQSEELRKGIQVSVVSANRMKATMASIYRTSNYIAEPYTALVYGALIDVRSRMGVGRQTLILSEESPAYSLGLIAGILGMDPMEVKKEIEKA